MRCSSPALSLAALAVLLLSSPAVAQSRPSDCGYYNYGRAGVASGRQCNGIADAPPPQRVTALCRDGSYSYDVGSSTCFFRGGVAIWRH